MQIWFAIAYWAQTIALGIFIGGGLVILHYMLLSTLGYWIPYIFPEDLLACFLQTTVWAIVFNLVAHPFSQILFHFFRTLVMRNSI